MFQSVISLRYFIISPHQYTTMVSKSDTHCQPLRLEVVLGEVWVVGL